MVVSQSSLTPWGVSVALTKVGMIQAKVGYGYHVGYGYGVITIAKVGYGYHVLSVTAL